MKIHQKQSKTLTQTSYMNLEIVVQSNCPTNWNKNLLNSKLGNIHQTKEYGEFVKNRLKSEPLYVKFHNKKGDTVGQVLLVQSFKGRGRLSEVFGRGFVFSTVGKFSKFLSKHYMWKSGPVIFNDDYKTEIIESFGNLLVSWKDGFSGSFHPLNHDMDFPEKFRFKRSKLATFIIDLRNDLREILKKTDKKSVQKNIERSQERGVTVTEIQSEKDLLVYYELQKQHRLKSNVSPYLWKDVVEWYNVLRPIGDKGLLAWYGEIPVGGILFSTFNGYINESGIARSRLDAEKKLYAQDLLRWNIIEWGYRNNCRYYDLTGVKLENRSPKEEGIFRNKKKWGGKLHEYYIFQK